MKNLISKFDLLFSTKPQLIFTILTIALFVLAAGAPNATIGIGR